MRYKVLGCGNPIALWQPTGTSHFDTWCKVWCVPAILVRVATGSGNVFWLPYQTILC